MKTWRCPVTGAPIGQRRLDMATCTNPQGQSRGERRRNSRLREINPDARIRIEHFLHATPAWADSPIDYLALRVIHEAYPELSSHDVRVLMEAIEARYRKGQDRV
jgi:hypothetical protein